MGRLLTYSASGEKALEPSASYRPGISQILLSPWVEGHLLVLCTPQNQQRHILIRQLVIFVCGIAATEDEQENAVLRQRTTLN